MPFLADPVSLVGRGLPSDTQGSQVGRARAMAPIGAEPRQRAWRGAESQRPVAARSIATRGANHLTAEDRSLVIGVSSNSP